MPIGILSWPLIGYGIWDILSTGKSYHDDGRGFGRGALIAATGWDVYEGTWDYRDAVGGASVAAGVGARMAGSKLANGYINKHILPKGVVL